MFRYMALPQGSKVQAEYVWLGGTGSDLRCKTRTLDEKPTAVDQLPLWNYDGSSCGQAPGDDSEVMLRPVKIYPVSDLAVQGTTAVVVRCLFFGVGLAREVRTGLQHMIRPEV